MSLQLPASISLRNSAHFARLWAAVAPLHRKLDGKFQAIDEAFQRLEERSNTYYPMVLKIDSDGLSVGEALDLTITGVNFSTDETEISVTIGNQVASITAGASTTVFHATLTGVQAGNLGSAGESVVVLVRVSSVLAPAILVPLIA